MILSKTPSVHTYAYGYETVITLIVGIIVWTGICPLVDIPKTPFHPIWLGLTLFGIIIPIVAHILLRYFFRRGNDRTFRSTLLVFGLMVSIKLTVSCLLTKFAIHPLFCDAEVELKKGTQPSNMVYWSIFFPLYIVGNILANVGMLVIVERGRTNEKNHLLPTDHDTIIS